MVDETVKMDYTVIININQTLTSLLNALIGKALDLFN